MELDKLKEKNQKKLEQVQKHKKEEQEVQQELLQGLNEKIKLQRSKE